MKWSDLDRWEKVGVVIVAPFAIICAALFIVSWAVEKFIGKPVVRLLDAGIDAWLKIFDGGRHE